MNDPVYQYHPLFRDFLLSRMESLFRPDEITSIRRKAALILEESGRVEEAAALFRDAGDCDGTYPTNYQPGPIPDVPGKE